jgi:hypothetical protein
VGPRAVLDAVRIRKRSLNLDLKTLIFKRIKWEYLINIKINTVHQHKIVMRRLKRCLDFSAYGFLKFSTISGHPIPEVLQVNKGVATAGGTIGLQYASFPFSLTHDFSISTKRKYNKAEESEM